MGAVLVGMCDPWPTKSTAVPAPVCRHALCGSREGVSKELRDLYGFSGWQADFRYRVHLPDSCTRMSLNLEGEAESSHLLGDSKSFSLHFKRTRPRSRLPGPNELSPSRKLLRVCVTAQCGCLQGILCPLRKCHNTSALGYE